LRLSVLHVVPAASSNPLLIGMLDGVDGDFSVAAFGSGPTELGNDCSERGIPFRELGEMGSALSMANSIRRVIKSLTPDVVEVHTFRPSVAAAVLAMSMPVRPGLVAVRHHNLNHYLQDSVLGRWGDRLVNAKVDGVVAVSFAVRDTCITEGLDPDRCHVALNGLDFSRFLVAEPESGCVSRGAEHLLLAVGRLDWQKDYPTLLRCVARLVERGSDVELAVLGTGSAAVASELVDLCTELGISNRVRWMGWQPDVERWMHAADVFVHSAADEAHPLVLMEVLAAGLPLVATAAGGSREVVQQFYEVSPVGDSLALALKVEQVLDDLANQRSYAMSVRHQVPERFSPERMAEAHLAACRAVLLSNVDK